MFFLEEMLEWTENFPDTMFGKGPILWTVFPNTVSRLFSCSESEKKKLFLVYFRQKGFPSFGIFYLELFLLNKDCEKFSKKSKKKDLGLLFETKWEFFWKKSFRVVKITEIFQIIINLKEIFEDQTQGFSIFLQISRFCRMSFQKESGISLKKPDAT